MPVIRPSRVAAAALFSLGAYAVFHAARGGATPALAVAPSLPQETLAIVATAHEAFARTSEARLVTVDATGAHERTLGAFAHAPGAVVRGDIVDAGAVVIAADEEGARDPDWGALLLRVDAGGPRVLARGLYHASRPLVSRDGSVYVERGASGPAPSADDLTRGQLRVDALSIDAIDPSSGAARTTFSATGYTLHLAGELHDELLVDFVSPAGATILAIDRRTGAARRVASVPPFARDFSVDEANGDLVMSNRDATDPRLWTVERVGISSGIVTRLYAQRDEAPAPFVLPGGSVAWSTGARRGLFVGARRLAPLGAGFDAVSARGSEWIAVDHVASSGYDDAAAVHVSSGIAARLTTRDERVTVLGFVGVKNGGAR